MKTFSFTNQNDVYIEQEARQNTFLPSFGGIIKSITGMVKSVKTKINAIGGKCMQLIRPVDMYRTVNVKHLHKSCQKMDEPKRKVFFLYVKGYSVDEIGSASGMKPHSIIVLVHNMMKAIHKESSIL